MFIFYPTIYAMTMLTLVSYIKLVIEWKYPVYPDSTLNFPTYSFHEQIKGNTRGPPSGELLSLITMT
jgi:hypothetical protein